MDGKLTHNRFPDLLFCYPKETSVLQAGHGKSLGEGFQSEAGS